MTYFITFPPPAEINNAFSKDGTILDTLRRLFLPEFFLLVSVCSSLAHGLFNNFPLCFCSPDSFDRKWPKTSQFIVLSRGTGLYLHYIWDCGLGKVVVILACLFSFICILLFVAFNIVVHVLIYYALNSNVSNSLQWEMSERCWQLPWLFLAAEILCSKWIFQSWSQLVTKH